MKTFSTELKRLAASIALGGIVPLVAVVTIRLCSWNRGLAEHWFPVLWIAGIANWYLAGSTRPGLAGAFWGCVAGIILSQGLATRAPFWFGLAAAFALAGVAILRKRARQN